MSKAYLNIAHASYDAGIDPKLPIVIKGIFDQTVARGYGKDCMNSMMEVRQKIFFKRKQLSLQ